MSDYMDELRGGNPPSYKLYNKVDWQGNPMAHDEHGNLITVYLVMEWVDDIEDGEVQWGEHMVRGVFKSRVGAEGWVLRNAGNSPAVEIVEYILRA